jgi:hypothetical protein
MRTNQNHTAGVEVVLPMNLEKARRPAMCKRQKQERPLVALVRRTRRKRGKRTMMSVRSARLTEPICRGTEASVSTSLTDRSVHVWSRPKHRPDRFGGMRIGWAGRGSGRDDVLSVRMVFLRAMVYLTYEAVRLKYEAVRPGFSRTIQRHFSRPDRRRTRASQSCVTDGRRKTRFFLWTKFVFLMYHGFVTITTSSRIISRLLYIIR